MRIVTRIAIIIIIAIINDDDIILITRIINDDRIITITISSSAFCCFKVRSIPWEEEKESESRFVSRIGLNMQKKSNLIHNNIYLQFFTLFAFVA